MIPLFVTVRVNAAGARPIFIWLPLFLLWILLSPVWVLGLMIVFVAAAVTGANPFAAVGALIAVFCALSGTHVEVNAPGSRVLVNIT